MASLTRTLLVVCPEGPALRVFTCVAGLRGWSVGREDMVSLPAGEVQSGAQPLPEAIAAALRPVVLRWGVPPGTEVAVVLPPATGGIVSIRDRSGRGRARVDTAWLDAELAGRIPFALKDIEYETRTSASGSERLIQVTWMPRTLAIEFRAAFARLGLTLGELVFRAQLYALHGHGGGRRTEMLIEPWAGWTCFHLLAGRRVIRTSIAQTPATRALADRLRLELLSLENHAAPSALVLSGAKEQGEVEAEIRRAAPGIAFERCSTSVSELFVRFWRAGESGIWPVPENPPPLAMARRLAFAMAGCGAVIAAALAWDASAISDEAAALQAREARLRPQYRALRTKEQQIAAAAATADALARIETAPVETQAALMAVFNALPRTAWVTRFSFEGNTATVAGRGSDTQAVIAGLKRQPGVSRVDIEPATGSKGPDSAQAFRVVFHWTPAEPGRERAPAHAAGATGRR